MLHTYTVKSKSQMEYASKSCLSEGYVCLFKRLLQTRGSYKITSNIKKKHCVNTINITEK